MVRRDRTPLFGLAALALMLTGLTLAGVNQDVLLAAPALVLALLLLTGRYVGEEGIARLAAAYDAGRGRRRRAAASLVPTGHGAPRILPRGGRLIATALAVRPPPAAPLSITA